MSTVSSSSPSNAHETTLLSNLTSETTVSTNDTISLLSEITSYFIRRGFQSSLVRSFLEREVHLDLKTNGQLMFDFLRERERLDPVIFIGIEGSGVSGVVSGEDERLLVKWGLTEEAARELRHSVRDDTLWSQQALYHWLFDWITNPWGSFVQMSFDNIFYNEQYPRNQWNSYDRKGGPQMFASSYQDIIDMGIDELLSNNTKATNADSMNTTYRAFFHATNQQNAQAICKRGIKITQGRINLDFGSAQSFYLNPSLDNAIDLIKNIEGFNGLVVYWVDIDKIKGVNYRDLVSEGEDLWKEVVIASRCGQPSAVDNDDYVYGYQLSNPRPILSQWANCDENDEDSWRQLIPMDKWFEPIRHLQLAIKTIKAAKLMDSFCVGVIYFHTKPVEPVNQ